MVYAVNLINLLSLKELDPVGALLFPPEILGDVVFPERHRLGTDSVALLCDEERAEAIVEVVRKKYTKKELMLFQSKTGRGSWKRI